MSTFNSNTFTTRVVTVTFTDYHSYLEHGSEGLARDVLNSFRHLVDGHLQRRNKRQRHDLLMLTRPEMLRLHLL